MEAAGSKSAPKPRSPPNYPDFCGSRRLHLEVETLNREVGFLQEELQSLEGLQPVSTRCKAVNEFVGTNLDPLLPIIKKKRGCCYICKWIGSKVCSTFSWNFCCTGCSNSKRPNSCICCCPLKNLLCCCGYKCDCFHCSCCRLPRTCKSKEGSSFFRNLPSCGLPRCCGCKEASCWKNPCCRCCCCFLPTCSWPEYSCGCVFDCPKCTGINLCPKCSKPCCVTGCLC